MNTTILLVVLVVFAFAISRVLTRYASRYFVVSGVEYLALGLVLGPLTGVLEPETLATFSPLISLLLGLVGFIVGLHALVVRREPRQALSGALAALGVLVLVAVAAASFVHLSAAPGVVGPITGLAVTGDQLRAAGTIGCCAAVASPHLISGTAKVLRARGPALDVLQTQASASQLVALAVFGAIMASARAAQTADSMDVPVAVWATGMALFGLVCGLLFNLSVGEGEDEMRVYIAGVGVVTFASGIGVALEVSPLVINLIAGVFVALSSRHAEALERTMLRLRPPSLIMVRLFAGATWVTAQGVAWLLLPIYALGRFAGYRTLAYPAARICGVQVPRLPHLGQALLGQGGLAVAIALGFATRSASGEAAGLVLTVVVGGLVLGELFSHRATRRVLADAGELHVVPEQEIAAAIEAEAKAAEVDAGGHGHEGEHEHEDSADDTEAGDADADEDEGS